MLTFKVNRRLRHAKKPVAQAAPPAPLVLVAAGFDPDGPEVYLTFDRAIDVSGLVVGQFVVDDGPDGHHLVGFEAPSIVSPTEVSVVMLISGGAGGADVVLNVGAGNGIVAVDDGGTWAGCAAPCCRSGEAGAAGATSAWRWRRRWGGRRCRGGA